MNSVYMAALREQAALPGSLAIRYPQEASTRDLLQAIGVSHVWWHSPLSPSLNEHLPPPADLNGTRTHHAPSFPTYACLASQLYLLSGAEHRETPLFDVICVPVVLCFSLSKDARFPKGQKVLSLLPDLPPPQIGEYALIVEQEGACAYAIHELPLAARRIWENLGDLLRELASPGSWPLWVPTHTIASDPITFLEMTNELSRLIRHGRSKVQEDARMDLSALESARTALSDAHRAKQKATYNRNLRDVQESAQTLADAYFTHHRWKRKSVCLSRVTIPDFDGISVAQKQNLPPSFDSFWANRRQKQDREVWGTIAVARGTTQLVISPPPREILQALFSAVNTLGEEGIGSFVALLVLYLEHQQQHTPQQPFFVDLDELLRVRDGLPPEERVTKLQRASLLAQVETISRIQLLIFLPDEISTGLRVGGGRQNTGLQVRSCVLQVSGRISMYEEGTGDALQEKWSVVLGSWQKVLHSWWPRRTNTVRQLLAFGNTLDPRTKQLGIFLVLLFHCSTDTSPEQEPELECTAVELCDAAGILFSPSCEAPLALLEHSLDTLCEEGILRRYMRLIDAALQSETKDTGQERGLYQPFKYLIVEQPMGGY